MLRRVHVPTIHAADLELPENEAHHVRDVLRLEVDDELELFDPAGRTAGAAITAISAMGVTVRIKEVIEPCQLTRLTIGSALPKGDRADWMIEKLSELGVHRFVPLQTERSIVHPQGTSKFERWARIAAESAKQSRRSGIMQIEPLMPLDACIDAAAPLSLYLAPRASALLSSLEAQVSDLTLFIGPEGGWTDDELALFGSHSVAPARLTDSILRIETAAIAAAAVAQCVLSASFSNHRSKI